MRTVELLTGVPLGETQVLLSQQTNENLVDLIESATEQLVDDGDAETIAEMLGAVLTVAK